LFSKTQFHVVSTSHLQSINCKWFLHLREHFMFHTFSFSCFSLHLCLFLLFLTAIDLVMCVSVRNIVLSLWQVCSCLSLGDALPFSHFDDSLLLVMYFYITHWGQCVIQVWGYGKILCLFVYLFLFVLFVLKRKKREKRNSVMFLIEHDYIALWFAYHWFV